MSLLRHAAGGESCKQDSFLCVALCRGNMPLCGARGAQRIGEDEYQILKCEKNTNKYNINENCKKNADKNIDICE